MLIRFYYIHQQPVQCAPATEIPCVSPQVCYPGWMHIIGRADTKTRHLKFASRKRGTHYSDSIIITITVCSLNVLIVSYSSINIPPPDPSWASAKQQRQVWAVSRRLTEGDCQYVHMCFKCSWTDSYRFIKFRLGKPSINMAIKINKTFCTCFKCTLRRSKTGHLFLAAAWIIQTHKLWWHPVVQF